MALIGVIRRDVFSKFSGEVLSRSIYLLFFFFVGRRLGTADFGSLSVALSVTYILGVVFLDPGLNLAAIHMLVERPQEGARIASSILSLKLLLFAPLLIVLTAMKWIFGSRLPLLPALLLAALFTLFTALLEYFAAVTNAYHRMDLEAYFKIFNRGLIVVLGWLALSRGSIDSLLLAMVEATCIAALAAWWLLRSRLVATSLGWHLEHARGAIVAGLPIAGTMIVSTIYLKWDLLVLSYFSIGREQVGWYAGAFKIVEAFSSLPAILGAALFPVLIQLRMENSGSLERLLNLTTKAVLLFSIPVAAAMSLFSPQIISLVYGPRYLPGARVLAVLIWCIVPIFLYFYLVFVNVAAGHASHNLLAGCAALVAGLAANAILVPRIGYLGAAWAALLANTSFAVFATWKVCRVFQKASLPSTLLRLTAAGAVMMAVLGLGPASSLLRLFLGLLAYIVALVALGSLKVEDWSLAVRLAQFTAQPQQP